MEVQAYAPFKKIQTAVFIIFEIIKKLATIWFLMIEKEATIMKVLLLPYDCNLRIIFT